MHPSIFLSVARSIHSFIFPAGGEAESLCVEMKKSSKQKRKEEKKEERLPRLQAENERKKSPEIDG